MNKLSECAKRWRQSLTDAATGPLIVAKEIVELCQHWERHQEDAGGLTASAFLRRELGGGRDLAFFNRRVQAIAKLGEDIRRFMHHDVAVWVANNFEGEDLLKVKRAIFFATKRSAPLSLAQSRAIAFKITNQHTEKKPRVCASCEELKELLAKHGIRSA